MSSYIAPNRYADKTHFNTTEFKSALTVDDVDSKLTTKLESPASSYIDSGTFENTSSGTSATIDFTRTFTSAPIVVCTCVNASTSVAKSAHVKEGTVTTDQFTLAFPSASTAINWIAIGTA